MTQFLLHRADRRYSPYDTDVADHTAATLGNASPVPRVATAPPRRFLAVLMALCALLLSVSLANATRIGDYSSMPDGYYDWDGITPANTSTSTVFTVSVDPTDAHFRISDGGATITIFKSMDFPTILFGTTIATTKFKIVLENGAVVDFGMTNPPNANIQVHTGALYTDADILITGDGEIKAHIIKVNTDNTNPKIYIEGDVSVTFDKIAAAPVATSLSGSAAIDPQYLSISTTGTVTSASPALSVSGGEYKFIDVEWLNKQYTGQNINAPTFDIEQQVPSYPVVDPNDYTISYSDLPPWVSAGEYTIYVTFPATATDPERIFAQKVTIDPKPIHESWIDLTRTTSYLNGVSHPPFTTVTDGFLGYTLLTSGANPDYKVEYWNIGADPTSDVPIAAPGNAPSYIDADSAIVRIVGLGNYCDTVLWEYRNNRIPMPEFVANNYPTRPTGLKYDNTSHTLLTPPLVTPSGCVGIEYTAALTSRPATPTFGYLVPPAVVDAGEYVVGVLYKGDRNHLDQEDWGAIDVEKSPDLTITWPTYTSPITYTEDDLDHLTAATPGSIYHATISPITGGTFAWENPLDTAIVPSGDYSMRLNVTTITAPTNAYTNFDWDSIAKLAGITYDGTYLYKDITIAVNPLQAYNITKPTPASVPYNGYAQAALSALGSSTQGKVQYSADNGTTYTDTIPKFKNAGSYPIEYKIVATSPNYSDNSSVASSGGTLTPISPFVINQVQLDLIVDDVTISDTATAFPSDLTWRTGTHGFLGEDQYGTNYLSVDGGFSNAINYIGAYTLPYNSGPGDPNATMPTPEVNAFDFSGSPFTPGYQTTDGNYIVNSVTKGSLTFVIGAALKGTVNLSPTSPLAGQRLEAHLSTTLPGTLTLTYEWYIGGARVQGPSGQDYYDITAAEVGKQIEVKVTAANYAGYLISISPAVAKSPYGNHGGPLPVAIGSVTATSITFNTPSSAEIYEYSIDGGLTWQSSPYFDGSSPTPVTAGNTFACVQRVAETSAELASTSSTPVSVPTPTQDAFDCAVVKAWLELLTFQNIHYTQANDITAARDTLQARLDRRLATYLAGNPSILSTFTLTVMADGTFVPATASNGNGSWTGFSINVNATFGTGSTAMSASPSNSVTILYEGYTLKVSITGQGRNTVTIDGVSATGTVVGANTEYYVSYGQQIDINAAPYYGQKFQNFQFSGTLPSGITSPASGTPGPGYPTAPTYGISSDISFTIPAGDVIVNPTYIPDAVWVANDGQARILADILADITGFTTTQVLAPSQTNAHTIAQTEANRVATATATAQSPAITGYVVTVVDNVWKPAEAGTASNPAGIDGYLDFNVNVQVANATTVISGVVRLVVKATPWVNAKEPFIYRQPQYNMVVYASNGTANISVQANSTDGGTLEYQWFSNSVESYTGGTAITGVITGASGASVNVPISEAGTHYYYVVITNRNTNVTGVKTATVRSQIVSITVRPVITQSPYMRAVNVKEDNVKDYVTVSPRFGVHWIESRSDFSFTVHANDGYDLSGLTVKTDVPLDVKIEKAPAESDGAITTVTVTLLFVNLEVNVTLDGVVAVGSSAGGIGGGETTGNAAIANSSLRVWSLDRDLYIGGLQQGKAFSVYNIAGKLIYTGVSSNGKTEHVRIPAAGIYLLKTDDKTVKALVK